MATFNIVLDRRRLLKDGRYNLAIRITVNGDVLYLNIVSITKQNYEYVFVKKSTDEDSVSFRETCNGYIAKCERIFESLKPFNKEEFRKRFYQKENLISKELLIRDLFDKYIQTKELKPNTIVQVRTSKNVIETFKPDVTVFDITSQFLKDFENS